MLSGSRWTIGWACAALACGCGGSEAAPEPGPAPQQAAADAPAPPAPQGPPPTVLLAWQPGGELSVANVGTEAVSLRRAVGVRGVAGVSELSLAVTCLPPSDSPCITLVPGAAVRVGRWPDSLGACRCTPCVAVPPAAEDVAAVSLVVQGCEPGQPTTLALPAP